MMVSFVVSAVVSAVVYAVVYAGRALSLPPVSR